MRQPLDKDYREPGRESGRSPKIVEINTADGLLDLRVLSDVAYGEINEAQFFDQRQKHKQEIIDKPESDNAKRARRALEMINIGGMKIIGIYGTGDKKGILLAGGAIILEDVKGETRGWIASDSTILSARGKGYMEKLTNDRVAWAKEQDGCTGVDAQVKASNPIGLATKLKSGFYVSKFHDDGQGGKSFLISLDFKPGDSRERKRRPGESLMTEEEQEGRFREVALSNLELINDLLKDKEWRGVDIKNMGPANSNDPNEWKLILEKVPKKSRATS